MNVKIKDKVSSYPGCDSFRYRQQRETLRPHIISVLPPQAAVTSTYLRQSILSFYLLLTSIQSTLKQNCFARPQPLVSSTTWTKYLRSLESQGKLPATTGRNTAIMSSRNLLKGGGLLIYAPSWPKFGIRTFDCVRLSDWLRSITELNRTQLNSIHGLS